MTLKPSCVDPAATAHASSRQTSWLCCKHIFIPFKSCKGKCQHETELTAHYLLQKSDLYQNIFHMH